MHTQGTAREASPHQPRQSGSSSKRVMKPLRWRLVQPAGNLGLYRAPLCRLLLLLLLLLPDDQSGRSGAARGLVLLPPSSFRPFARPLRCYSWAPPPSSCRLTARSAHDAGTAHTYIGEDAEPRGVYSPRGTGCVLGDVILPSRRRGCRCALYIRIGTAANARCEVLNSRLVRASARLARRGERFLLGLIMMRAKFNGAVL